MLPPTLFNDLMRVVEAGAERARISARGTAIRLGASLTAGLLTLSPLTFLSIGF